MPNGLQVFLSFNSRDREKVRAVRRFLDQRGIATFFDEQNLDLIVSTFRFVLNLIEEVIFDGKQWVDSLSFDTIVSNP